jgi:hypothetical protein
MTMENEWKWYDLKKEEKDDLVCFSVGYILGETDNDLKLSAHRAEKVDSDNTIQACGKMTIPKCAIIEIRQLRTNGKRPKKKK